ncbi:MAG: hypothetical protein ACRD4E_09690, partial [Bryobacteraceae bacterium]
MFPGRVLGCIALVLAGLTAVATCQNRAATVRGEHAWMTVVTQSDSPVAQADGMDAKTVTIFNNLAKRYPKGLYWCCTGYNVMGPSSGVGVQWMAAPFTPSANRTVTKIEVAAGYSQQGKNGIVVSLNLDNNGAPGNAVQTWNVSGLTRFGDCCGLVIVTSSSGIAVNGGQQYWIVLSTDSSEQDTVDGWN